MKNLIKQIISAKFTTLLVVLLGVMLVQACSEKQSSKQPTPSSHIPVGVQLWSVQDALKKDFEGTIKSLADMGFEAVEFAGVFGKYEQDPKALKAFLQKQGLVVSGAHVGFDKLTQDKIDATLSFYKTLGANYLIIPWDDRSWQPDGVMEVVNELNELLPQINAAGFAFGYHNHSEEFNEFKSQTYWDYIAQNTDKNMVLQLDIGWVNFADKDPIHYVKEYEGRTLTTHYKVRTHDGLDKEGKPLSPILGEDGYDWTELFNVMKEFGGTKWIILEQEEYPNGLTSVEAVRKSKQGLDKLLSEVNRK